jgi:hypothetical protein
MTSLRLRWDSVRMTWLQCIGGLFLNLYFLLLLEAINAVQKRLLPLLQTQIHTHTQMHGHTYTNTQTHTFDISAVKNEMQWIFQHLYCSGLDKASNNACFICIRHIRLMAFERLSGNDFIPCKRNDIWSLPSAILDQVSNDLASILP